MTSYKKLAFSAVFFLLFSLPMFGQYTSNYTQGLADALNSTTSPSPRYDCVSDNCFVALPASPVTFLRLNVSPDGEIQAIDAQYNRWHWNQTTGAWSALGGGLSGTFKAVHVGSFNKLYYLAFTTEANNNTYWFTGGAWAHLGPNNTWCLDGDVSSDGQYYCLSSGYVFHWNGSSWATIRSTADAVSISAFAGGVAIVNNSGNLYLSDSSSGVWTHVTTLPFTPATWLGSIAFSDDGSMSIEDGSLNIHISHDRGATWSTVNSTGIQAISQVANGNAMTSMVLDAEGNVWHLNTIVPQHTMTLSGTCGSACGGGNPAVIVAFESAGTGTQFSCPNPWVYWTQGVVDCGFNTNANTVQNTPPALSFEPGCDQFAPGPQCQEVGPIIEVVVTFGGEIVYSNVKTSSSKPRGMWVNQKYKILSSTTGPATPETIFGWHVPGEYYWTGVNVDQWCTNSPLIPNAAPTTIINYMGAGSTTPSSMPGAYINVDIPAGMFADGEIVAAPYTNFVNNWKTGLGQGSSFIYTWNSTSAKRGPGGNPTALCTGE